MARSDVFLCELCPKNCRISEGHSGDCRARIVVDGELRAVTYGKPCAVHIDPVERKPLFHFLPGTPVLSLATADCNLHCKFCQNWTISQAGPEDIPNVDLPPEDAVRLALARGCPSMSYTYTEPVIYFEYTYRASELAHQNGLRTITVTAGYISRRPMEMLCGVIDASNTDIKAFNEGFYREVCDASLKPVLDGVVLMKERACG